MLASHSAHRTQGLILHRKVALAGPRPLVEKCLDGSGGEQLVQTSLQHRRQGPSVDSSTWFPLQTGMRSQTMNDGPAVARQGSLSPLQFSAGPGNYLCFLGGAMAFGMSKILNWPRLERLFSQSIAWQLLTMDNLWAGSMSRPGPVHLYVLSRLLAKVSPTRVILSGLSLGNVAATGCVQVTEVAISHSIRALVLWDHVILPGYTLKPVRLVNCSGTTTKPCLYPEFSTPPCRLQAPGILIRCSWYEHETIDAVNDYVYAMQSFGAPYKHLPRRLVGHHSGAELRGRVVSPHERRQRLGVGSLNTRGQQMHAALKVSELSEFEVCTKPAVEIR
eukprot:s1486_g15.t1